MLLAGSAGGYDGMVLVRDTMLLGDDAPASEAARDLPVLPAETPVYAALRTMREDRARLVLVRTDAGSGVLTLTDVLARLVPLPRSE